MLKGLPASLKTSWAKKQQEQGNFIIVSKDEIRKIYGSYTARREKDVLRTRNELIKLGIKLKRNVIVDDTNLNPKHEIYLRQLAKELGVKFEVNDSFLKEEPEDCIARDLHRGDKAVGADVIWKMYYKWVAPNPVKKLDKNTDKPRAVICSLDDTLAMGDISNPIAKLTINPFIVCSIDALYHYGIEKNGEPYPSIIILTSRSKNQREEIESWLARNLVPYDELYMNDNDENADEIFKERTYHDKIEPNYAILGVFEGQAKMSRIWRKLGLLVAQTGYPEINL